jgi:gamma-glutamyl hercynylcysteine S-oxide synthase
VLSSALRRELSAARDETDALFRIVSPDALFRRPVSERHRLIFYLGHIDAFDWNLLARRSMSEKSFHADFDTLFERGIDPEPGHAPSDSPKDWPARDEIESYNARARDWIDRHFDALDENVVQMAIEHRLMHAETLAYLIHELPDADKLGPAPNHEARPSPRNPMLPVAAGPATLGKTAEGFGWDNEYQAHEVPVPEFSIAKYKITNGQFLEFVREGGAPSPFWEKKDGAWYWRGMFGLVPLPHDWPVWVTWRQADAYAQWRGATLPSEAQWHRAKPGVDPVADNFGFQSWDPVAVDNGLGAGPQQMTGNGWEWTNDVFAPFPGFESHPFYPGYSSDFFDGKHYVMKGASPRTASLLARESFRNWFRPEYPHVFAGFRIVANHREN